MEFIISLLPTMKSTTCVSSQAGRQMRWEEEGEEEEEEEGEEEEQPRSGVSIKGLKQYTDHRHIHSSSCWSTLLSGSQTQKI